jgi:hypothetical protein
MLATPIRSLRSVRSLTILLLAAAFVSCASEAPKQTALMGDPDSNSSHDSSIPWNKPQQWEGTAGLPLGLSGADGSNNPNNPAGY